MLFIGLIPFETIYAVLSWISKCRKIYIFWRNILPQYSSVKPFTPAQPSKAKKSRVQPCVAHNSPLEHTKRQQRTAHSLQSIAAQYSPVKPSTAQYSPVQPSTFHHSPVQPNRAQFIPVQPTTDHFSTVQPCKALYSPVQPNTAQGSPVQPSTD